MTSHQANRNSIRLLGVGILLWGVLMPPTAGAKEKLPPVVAFRISHQFLKEVVETRQQVVAPINTQFMGAEVRGTATTNFVYGIDYSDLNDDKPISVNLSGSMYTDTRSYKGPAIIHASARTQFSGRYQLDFDGRAFTYKVLSVKACTNNQINQVHSTRRGLFRGIVRKVARRRAHENLPRARYRTSANTQERIRKESEASLARAVNELNDMKVFSETFTLAFPLVKDIDAHLSSNAAFLETRLIDKTNPGKSPPGKEMLGHHPLEIWIAADVTDEQVDQIEANWNVARPILAKMFSNVPELKNAFEKPLVAEDVGDWVVIMVAKSVIEPAVKTLSPGKSLQDRSVTSR